MMKVIFCFALAAIACLPVYAQTAAADSIRSLVLKLNAIPGGMQSSCKGVADYKTRLEALSPGDFNTTLVQLIAADSQFLHTSKADCPAHKTVAVIDSFLRSVRQQAPPDSTEILKAVLYVKSRYAGFVNIRLALAPVTAGKIVVVVNGTDPSILSPYANADSTLPEIFLRPGKKYVLQIAASGYKAYTGALGPVQNDTTVAVKLSEAAAAGTGHEPGRGPQQEQKPQSYWLPALAVALLLTSIFLLILLLKKRKREGYTISEMGAGAQAITAEASLGGLNKKLAAQDLLINKYRSEIEALQAGADTRAAQLLMEKKAIVDDPQPGKKKYFLSEVMVTAGPRKKPMNEPDADKDLGEDVCGLLTAGEEVLVWLLDGTSDFYCLRNPDTGREYFSSRLLAQSLARKLKLHFRDKNWQNLSKTMLSILGEVRQDWLDAIHDLPRTEQEILVTNIRSGNCPECAATVLIAGLSLSGDLTVYRSGDSKMLIYQSSGEGLRYVETTLAGKNSRSNDRFFFRLVATEAGSLDIQHNQPLFEIVKEQNIRTIIGMSDGIGKDTEAELRTAYPANPDAVRHKVIYQVQGTEDDKALYIIEIDEKAFSPSS